MSKKGAAMHFLLVIVLSLHVGYSLRSSDSKHGSHNLLKLEATNSSVQRQVRCTPCEQDARRPVSNHLDPEYRGNGADNLGYDWSAMSWGGPAYPRRSKVYTGGMRGRDGRMMANDGGRSQGNVKVICDTCRSYWDGGRAGPRGRQYDMGDDQNYYAGQPWQRDGMRAPDHFETRVMSPTVGVLVKPGSRIAYIPSRSGEMFWDGVSGGGTRWDGFSNGISWIGNAPAEWDRSDAEPRDDSAALRPGGGYHQGSNAFGSWNNHNRQPNWGDNPGRGYYFSNGMPNDVDPQWRDRGYASNWHYGSTNQNGWNGNNMKWNYGGKQWADNDRAANRFYFNSPQDRTYGPTDGHRQYGNQYSNYQPSSSYPSDFTPQPWPGGGNYRPNDRFPSSFQGNFGDKDKPWDYTSRDQFGYRRPDTRPEWARPGPSYRPQGNFVGNYDKHSGSSDGYKYTPSDRNDFEKPWSRPGYGASKPDSSGGFPYGGNRYPNQGGGGGGRPSYSGGFGHMFYPNYGNPPGPGSWETRPPHPSGGRPPADPNYGNQIGNLGGNNVRPQHPGDKRPPITYTGARPPGGFPAEGNLPSGYPGTGTPSGGYPGGGSSSGGYTGSGSSSPGYASGGRPSIGNSSGDNTVTEGAYEGYPSGSGSGTYPAGNRPHFPGTSIVSGSYSSGGNRPFGGPFPSRGGPVGYPPSGRFPSGHKPDKFYGGDSSGVYPSGGSSYPRPGIYPSGGSSYPSGGSIYPSGGSTYPSGGDGPSGPSFPPYERYPSSWFFGGGRPMGYPTGGDGGGIIPGANPPGYPTGGNGGGNSRPGGSSPGYQGSYSRPGSGSSGGAYPTGVKNPSKGYYTGFITELGPDDGQVQYGGKNPNYFGSSYPGDKNAYPGKDRDRFYNGGSYPSGYSSGEKNRYPAFSEDRYSSGGGGGGGYPSGDNDRGGDRYYYGQSAGKGKYPAGYPSNHRFPGSGVDDFDRNQNSNNDKNSWNYGQNEHKEGIYRRSGGSYPPYRGGQYYTSSYLASMSTTAGSTQAGSEQKTQSVTKIDEVTQPTSDS